MTTTAAAAVVLVALVRRDHEGAAASAMRWGLAVILAAVTAGFLAVEAAGDRPVWEWLPLELCDVAIFIAVWSLLTLCPLGVELVWFWGLTASALSMVMPSVSEGFPHWRWLVYHVMHGGVALSAIVLALGFGIRPRPGAPWRAFGVGVLYTAGVSVVDLVSDANFMFLKHKPTEPTLLDWFGPWPWYLLVAGVVGLVLFHVLMLPFTLSRRRAPKPALQGPTGS